MERLKIIGIDLLTTKCFVHANIATEQFFQLNYVYDEKYVCTYTFVYKVHCASLWYCHCLRYSEVSHVHVRTLPMVFSGV